MNATEHLKVIISNIYILFIVFNTSSKKEKKTKMNKKILLMLIPIVALLLMAVTTISVASAVPTELTLTWSGFGSVATTFVSGDDAIARMLANGNTQGTFYAVDSDSSGYPSYFVDDTSSWMDSTITGGGGLLEFEYTRTDSMNFIQYGDPTQVGQNSFSRVSSSDTGALDFSVYSQSHYLQSYTYPTAPTNFQATGDFSVFHQLTSSLPANFGALEIIGSGSASVTHSYDISGYTGDSFSFGAGTGGCVWGTSISTTGSGTAVVWGNGEDYLRDGTYGQSSDWELLDGGSFTSIWNYNDGLSVTDYGFYGD